MLVLTRRPGESIVIAGDITITVVQVGPGRVKIGIDAPPHVRVDRQEIHEKIEQASDVLLAVGSGEATTSDMLNTMVAGPETAELSDKPIVVNNAAAAANTPKRISPLRKPR
jgi:carbon storage regulator CsrA